MSVHRRNLQTEARQRALFMLGAWVLGLMLMALVAWFMVDALALFARHDIASVLLGLRWDPARGHLGLMPYIFGTIVVGLVALVSAWPLAMGLALVLTKRLPTGVGRALEWGLTGMVAVPSVIFGWWGLDTLVPLIRRGFGGPGFSVLAAGLTLAVMVLPTLTVLSASALNSVPDSLEDASRALGASEDETLWHVTLRAATPGLARALVLSAGRALAETMAVQMVIGSQPVARLNLTWPGSTLTTGILTNMSVYPPGSPGGQAVTVMGFLLLVGTWWLSRELRHWEVTA